MTIQLISLINEVQTIDSIDIGPFVTQTRAGTTVTSEIAAAVVKRRVQCDLLEGGTTRWADVEGTSLVKPSGDPVELGGDGATEFTQLSDVPPAYLGKAGLLMCVNQAEDALVFTIDAATNVYLQSAANKDVTLDAQGTGDIFLTAGDDIELGAGGDVSLILDGALKINNAPTVASQSVLVAGVGTLEFTHGLLTGFTPV